MMEQRPAVFVTEVRLVRSSFRLLVIFVVLKSCVVVFVRNGSIRTSHKPNLCNEAVMSP